MSEGANSCTAPLHANPIPTCFWYSFHKLLQINAQCRGHMPRAWTDPRIQKFSINLLRNTHRGAGGEGGEMGPIPTCFWYSLHKLLQMKAQCRGHMPRAWTDPRIQKFSINLLRNTHLGAGGGMGQELVLKPPETDIFRHATSCGAAGYNKQNCHFRRKSPQCSRIAQQRVIRKSLWT